MADLSIASVRTAPIGVFDSGFGGLTVAREIVKALPHESILYVGDSARCPYGPRTLYETRGFVRQICSWLVERGVKMIVIACNTATAAGLDMARGTFDVPVLGVVEPGARAAAGWTVNNRVGVIATKATIESGVYTEAIREINPDITVFSVAAPRFVEIAELGIKMADGPVEDFKSQVSKAFIRAPFQEIARDYLEPLRRIGVDTLVMGCTHFPLIKTLIGGVIGHEVKLISSAEAVVDDVMDTLYGCNIAAPANNDPTYEFFTTGESIENFAKFGGRVFGHALEHVEHVDLPPYMGTLRSSGLAYTSVVRARQSGKAGNHG